MCGKSVGSLGCLPCGLLKYVEGALQLGDPATMIVPTDPRTVVNNAYLIHYFQLSIIPAFIYKEPHVWWSVPFS